MKRTATPRDPVGTRQALIETAFSEIYRNGFQPTGLEAILARAGLTKGAVYHHFKNKTELGHAVFDEVVVPWVRGRWIEPVRAARDPVAELLTRVRRLGRRPLRELALGCPLNNLIQEISGYEDGFRARMNALLDEWRGQLAVDLRRAKRGGLVHDGVRPTEVAAFVVAALEGVIGVAKPAVDPRAHRQAVAGFSTYLKSLRSPEVS